MDSVNGNGNLPIEPRRNILIEAKEQVREGVAPLPKKEGLSGAFFWLSAFYFVYCARPEDWIPGLHIFHWPSSLVCLRLLHPDECGTNQAPSGFNPGGALFSLSTTTNANRPVNLASGIYASQESNPRAGHNKRNKMHLAKKKRHSSPPS